MSGKRGRSHAGGGEDQRLDNAEAVLGYHFRDREVLARALVHSSASAETGIPSNQRQEFLGDAVLDLAVSELLMSRYPEIAEGKLTRMRAALVSSRSLARLGAELELGRWLLLGRGEAANEGRKKGGILADAYEAILGAVFLDGGYTEARAMVERHFRERIEIARTDCVDHKTEFQELTQQHKGSTPNYRVVDMSGPDHQREYTVEIILDGEALARGEGKSRKEAEQHAAKLAIEALEPSVEDA